MHRNVAQGAASGAHVSVAGGPARRRAVARSATSTPIVALGQPSSASTAFVAVGPSVVPVSPIEIAVSASAAAANVSAWRRVLPAALRRNAVKDPLAPTENVSARRAIRFAVIVAL